MPEFHNLPTTDLADEGDVDEGQHPRPRAALNIVAKAEVVGRAAGAGVDDRGDTERQAIAVDVQASIADTPEGMRMDVDQAGNDVFAANVDDLVAGFCGKVWPDGADPAADNRDVRPLEPTVVGR